jgi:hypothetical protein
MSLVIIDAEGGRSDIDPGIRSQCVENNRADWSTRLLRAHQRLENLHETVFGIPQLGSPISPSSMIAGESQKYLTKQKVTGIVSFIGELTVSILAWEKVVSPLVNGVIASISITSGGRVLKILTGAAYAMGWVALDRYIHSHIPLLNSSTVHVRDLNKISSWDRLMEMGEEFVSSNLISPSLYYAYLKILGVMERQRALNFLI